ncbi:antitoxin VbhA family protein [Leucobacter chromiireducens]|uniref:antitoxin VbhA family protein n=1 Tax=Leucobacter chromiireducens TaxID=283877 RepID=UPI001927E6A3|nr:antitoxin VbhA family protein [Leucobacter chromiireducens]
MAEDDESSSAPATPITEAEVEARLAAADGVLGAAGHAITDPVAREIVRRKIRGEITSEEADRLILAHHGVTPREQCPRECRFFKPRAMLSAAPMQGDQSEQDDHHSEPLFADPELQAIYDAAEPMPGDE